MEVRDTILSGLVIVQAEIEVTKGPGVRFSVEPFAQGTWRVVDFCGRRCIAMCPSSEWALMIAERLNASTVPIRDDL